MQINHFNKKRHIYFFMRVLLGILFINFLCVSSFAHDQKIIKVGFPSFKNFSEINDDGTYSGYTYEYLMNIIQYTNWKYEFVVDTPQKVHQMLLDGDIDLMGGIIKDSETEQLLDFPEYTCGYTYATLSASKDDDRFSTGDYEAINGKKIGVFKNAKRRISNLNDFCTTNGIKPQIVFYDREKYLLSALEKGEVDLILGGDLNLFSQTRVICNFSKSPYYFAVTKGKPDILRDLNFAIMQIELHNPIYAQKLYNKYFMEPDIEKIIFSTSEKKFIKNNPKLRVSVVTDWYPMIYKDYKTNTYKGLAIDILDTMSKLTQIEFEYIEAKDIQEAMDMVKEKRVDFAASIMNNFDISQGNDLLFTIPYIKGQRVLISDKDIYDINLSNYKEAGLKGASITDGNIKDINFFPSIKECLESIKRGESDYVKCNLYTAEILLRQDKKQNFVVSSIPEEDFKASFGLSVNSDKSLVTILQKVILSIPDDMVRSNIAKHTVNLNSNVSFDDFIYSNPKEAFIVLIVLFIFLGFTLYLWVTRFYEITRHAKSYRLLADSAGEICFIYRFSKDNLTMFGEKSYSIFGVTSVYNFKKKLQDENISTNYEGNRLLLDYILNSNNIEHTKIELQLYTKSCTWRWFEIIISTIYQNNKKQASQAIGRIRDIHDEYLEREELLMFSKQDQLTGLLNRRAGDHELKNSLSKIVDEEEGILLLLDIDFFKSHNDECGHIEGDNILKVVSQLMREYFSNSILIRWGGDEFLIYNEPPISRKDVDLKLNTIRNHLKNYKVYDKSRPITLSIGGVIINKYNKDYESVFQYADEMLYKVKEMGRDGISFYIK